MIESGTQVYWTQRDYSGNAARVIRTHTVGQPFDIDRSQGGTVTCCRLAIDRLANLDDLSTEESHHVLEKKSRAVDSSGHQAARNNGPARAEKSPARSLPVPPAKVPSVQDLAGRNPEPAWNEAVQPAKEKHRPTATGGSTQRTTDAVPVDRCNVLAIDFLNILVRAFHAGAPTETHAVRSMMQTVANTIRKLQPAHVVFAMDGGHNLRSQLLPSYKAHRKPEDPLLTAQKKLAEDALYVAGFDMMRIEDWEADDVLATLAVTHSDTVIASCDKDLLALTHLATRCRVYHPWGAGEFMDAETKLGIPAHHVTDYLSLCGDTSDGIPGVIGIGPKTAAQLLTEYDSLEAIIVAAKLGNIKGATGKKIAEQHQSALLCRRVVELNTRLPIKELHPFQPHPEWQIELQSMRLGSVAAIIESLNGQRFQISNSRSEISDPIHHPERETASATTQQVEPVENGSAGTLGFPADATAIDHRRQEATPPEATGRTTNPTGDTSDVIAAAVTSGAASGDSNYPHDSQQQLWHTAGFTELKESSGIPGTTLKPNWFALWRDGSKWLLDPNTKRHTCMSDSPFTDWRIDSRGPIDPKTNAVRH